MPGDDGQAGEDERSRDFAIIIGVPRYPKLSRDGAPADLQGPVYDAEKVREWIESSDGGGVPPEHVEYVTRSNGAAAATADPTRDAVVEAFTAMYARCWPNGPAGGPKVPTGRRLYVYVSGHGLAADLDHGALLCSNSTDNLYSTVAPYASIKAFRQAGFFEEFVIWFDGCLDWAGLEAEGINYNPRPGNSLHAPGPVFTAYAAHPRLKAMEAPDDSGQVRGIFTRTLLEGLEGRAANSAGLIDGFCLQKYLWNTMPKYLPEAAKINALIDKQPFVRTDPGFFFGKPKIVPKPSIVLHIGNEYDGAEAGVWGRDAQSSLSLLVKKTIKNGQIEVELDNGIYAVDVPSRGLRTAFEITGGVVTKL